MYLKPRLEGNESILLEEQVNKKRMNSTRYGLRIFFVKERGEKAQLANECALLIHFEAFLKREYWWELRKTNLQRAGGELFFIFTKCSVGNHVVP